MKNKAYFVNKLCVLTSIDPESEQGQDLYKLSVIDLLIAIKQATPKPSTVPEDEEERTVFDMVGYTRY